MKTRERLSSLGFFCIIQFTMFQSSKQPKSKFERFVQTGDALGNKELIAGQWYTRNKLKFRQAGIFFLCLVCAVLIGYSVYGWGNYAILGYFSDRQMWRDQVMEFQNYEAAHSVTGARNLAVGIAGVNSAGENKYDFYALVKNPNPRHIAYATYKFNFSGGETKVVETTILPLAERPIAVLGEKIDFFPDGPTLILQEVKWRRVDPHAVPDTQAYIAERADFAQENFAFSILDDDGLPIRRIEFDLTNRSSYSYWEAGFYAELISGGVTEAVIYFTVPRFLAGETNHIDLRSVSAGLNADELVVHWLTDVFSAKEYMKPSDL